MHNLLKLAVAFTILAIAHPSFGQSDEGHVTLANGDRLPARIVSISSDEVEFSSPLFLESVKLDSKTWARSDSATTRPLKTATSQSSYFDSRTVIA